MSMSQRQLKTGYYVLEGLNSFSTVAYAYYLYFFMERVFGFGFAYGAEGRSYNPLLTGRKLISFSSSGAPADWLEQSGSLEAVRTLFDRYFAGLCGMTVLDHVHFGNITPGASAYFVQARLDDVGRVVNRHFGGTTCH